MHETTFSENGDDVSRHDGVRDFRHSERPGEQLSARSKNYARPIAPGEVRPFRAARTLSPLVVTPTFVVDAVVNNTDATLKNTDTFNDGEVSIAVDPLNLNRIVMTAFSGSWGATAPLWLSTDGGSTWTKEFSINPPPGAGGVTGCPCDQTIDFGHSGPLAGAFLTSGPNNIYSARSSALTSATGAFNFLTVGGVVQPINHLGAPDANVDQPWLLVGLGPSHMAGMRLANTENVYLAYDNFVAGSDDLAPPLVPAPAPRSRARRRGDGGRSVAVHRRQHRREQHQLRQSRPSPDDRPPLRRRLRPFPAPHKSGAGGSQNIDYMLNRSTDYGKTWGPNGSPTGMVVANADSTQPQPKFCTVNALLGGVDHAAVDPVTGDVVYVYGNRDPVTGNDRLALRRLTPTPGGGLDIGPEVFVTGQVVAAIPSVAIAANRAIGIFYYTCDNSTGTYPTFSAHFSTSTDLGASFTDRVLETFLSPASDDGDDRQRVLGDYMQVKAVGNTFFGGFTGNGALFGRSFSNNDPIFFKLPAP